MPRILVLVAACAVGLVPAVQAQVFEAVSVRVAPADTMIRGLVGVQPGRVVVIGATLKHLVSVAFGLPEERVIGGPAWIDSTPYSITGTMGGESGREPAQRMLRAMLADRFGLKAHTEKRSLPGYVLTLARQDGRLGPQLKRSGEACAPLTPMASDGIAPPPPPPPPPPPGGSPLRPLFEREVRFRCPTVVFHGGMSARAFSIDELAFRLSRALVRPVIDRTGLAGEFDIDLTYQPDLNAGGPVTTTAGPSLFTALQDQLGLRLESTRVDGEVLVVDSAAPPIEN
jgi:uncharacterized protein (TIGR03435 family)